MVANPATARDEPDGSLGGTIHRANRGSALSRPPPWRSHAADRPARGDGAVARGRLAGTIRVRSCLAGGTAGAVPRGARTESDARGGLQPRYPYALAADGHGDRSQAGE